MTYFKEPETIDYTVDRTMTYSEVLSANDIVNVYGDALLQSNDENIINGWNNSVVAKVSDTDIKKISYSDYGATKDIKSGNGYNGEKEHVASQNKYVYTLSNPYKYVDKDGNKATACPLAGGAALGGRNSLLLIHE